MNRGMRGYTSKQGHEGHTKRDGGRGVVDKRWWERVGVITPGNVKQFSEFKKFVGNTKTIMNAENMEINEC